MEARDVIVVGAGPVGLSLALALARAGRSVTVLERKATISEHSRAPAIWPRTQEILADLGVIERFLERGIALDTVALFDVDRGRELVRLPLSELAGETAHPRLLILPQAETERLLCEAVRAHASAEIAFSTEVLELLDDGQRVAVHGRREGSPVTLSARHVIGCDGAHSRVRELIGASFPGQTYATSAALADLTFPDDSADLPFPRLSTRGPFAVAIRIDRDLWRLILPLTGEALPLERRIELAVAALFGRSTYSLIWKSEFRLHRRLSSRFGRGRIALAGDAAHLNSPVGGQGMNAGIQDTEPLSAALLEALDRDDPAALDRYAQTRRGEIERGVNRFTDALTRTLLAADGRLVAPTLAAASLATRSARLRRRLLRRVAMLDG